MIDDDLCTLFGDEEESIQHLFYYCHKSQELWDSVRQWIFNKTNINVNFTIENILFGEHKNTFNPLNFIMMNTKYYIYLCTKKKLSMHIFALQMFIKEKYIIESYVARKEMKTHKFDKKWNVWKNLFVL